MSCCKPCGCAWRIINTSKSRQPVELPPLPTPTPTPTPGVITRNIYVQGVSYEHESGHITYAEAFGDVYDSLPEFSNSMSKVQQLSVHGQWYDPSSPSPLSTNGLFVLQSLESINVPYRVVALTDGGTLATGEIVFTVQQQSWRD